MNPLNDKDFLLELDQQRHRDVYARITLLTFQETPISNIEGKITSGTINVDGSSAVRRTCSLSMVTLEDEVNLFYMGIDRKFKLFIGLRNTINTDYPDIIWFPMGLYVTTSLSTARQTNGYTISISGKDKMCLLNGDVSGGLPASTDFGTIEVVSADGTTITYDDVKVKDIIFNAVEVYGNELPYNIIINDLEDCGYELLEYQGDTPIYFFIKATENNQIIDNVSLDEKVQINITDENDETTTYTLGTLPDDFQFEKMLDDDSTGVNNPTVVTLTDSDSEDEYWIAKVEQGETAGYRQTDITYAGDLIGGIGDSITSILDKLVDMLGNFEYFYDLDGRFIFQKKRTYQYEKWNPASYGEGTSEVLFEPNIEKGNVFYNFEDNTLITTLNNTPNLLNVKNDFSIWGAKEGISGAEIDLHLRYALDTKPTKYVTYTCGSNYPSDISDENKKQYTYIAGDDGVWNLQSDGTTIICDWREVLYQMAVDYYKYHDVKDDFYFQVANNTRDENNVPLYPDGRTHYEQYYTDMIGFWRDIFSPTKEFMQQCLLSTKTYTKGEYYTKTEQDSSIVNRFPQYTVCNDASYDSEKIYYEKTTSVYYFSDTVMYEPDQLVFWIDFYDSQISDIGKYSVKAIGQRSKNVKDEDITAIYFRRTPSVVYVNSDNDNDDYGERNSAYTYVNSLDSLENCMIISSQKKSAWDVAQEYLNEYTAITESLSFTAVPVYYLKPNIRISLKDNYSKMNGEYLIDKITYSLSYNGTMTISATKVIENVI